MGSGLSKAMCRALKKAASRERGNLCPVVNVNVHAASETALIDGLVRRGLVTFDHDSSRGDEPPSWCSPDSDGVYRWGAPRINDAGRAAIAGCAA